MDKFYSVNELAKAGNANPRAIRLYIDKGLLKPMRIERILCFPQDAAQALEDILRVKRLGFSLDEIKACQANHDTAVMKGAIKRIEELMVDAEVEVTDLRCRLSHDLKRT
jgi:DNA-binding transcriptional MerR regulator